MIDLGVIGSADLASPQPADAAAGTDAFTMLLAALSAPAPTLPSCTQSAAAPPTDAPVLTTVEPSCGFGVAGSVPVVGIPAAAEPAAGVPTDVSPPDAAASTVDQPALVAGCGGVLDAPVVATPGDVPVDAVDAVDAPRPTAVEPAPPGPAPSALPVSVKPTTVPTDAQRDDTDASDGDRAQTTAHRAETAHGQDAPQTSAPVATPAFAPAPQTAPAPPSTPAPAPAIAGGGEHTSGTPTINRGAAVTDALPAGSETSATVDITASPSTPTAARPEPVAGDVAPVALGRLVAATVPQLRGAMNDMRLSVRLDPPTLGHVTIDISTRDGALHVVVRPSETSSAGVLDAQRTAVDAALANAGFELGGFDVRAGDQRDAPRPSSRPFSVDEGDTVSPTIDAPTDDGALRL